MKNIQKQKCLFFLIFFILFAVLAWLFPYLVDDWKWGQDARFSAFIEGFSNPEHSFHFYNNGRYLGNGLGWLAANHPIGKCLIMAGTLCAILLLTVKLVLLEPSQEVKENGRFFVLLLSMTGLLILLTPRDRFGESIAWSVAFMNYVVGAMMSLCTLWFLLSENTSGWKCLFAFLSAFLSCFFLENLTIGNMIFCAAWILYRSIRKKRIPLNVLFVTAGVFLGGILMLSDDGYRTIFSATAEKEYWSAHASSVSDMFLSAYKALVNSFSAHLLKENSLLVFLGLFTAFFLVRRKSEKKTVFALCGLSAVSLYFLLRYIFPDWQGIYGFKGETDLLATLVYYSTFLYIWIVCCPDRTRMERVLVLFFYMCCATAPLLVADPLSPRVFMPTYCFQIVVFLSAAMVWVGECKTGSLRLLTPVCLCLLAVAFVYLFSVYSVIHHYDNERLKYLRAMDAAHEEEAWLPRLPYEEYLIISYPFDKWQELYKPFYGIRPTLKLNICKFDNWQEYLQGLREKP